MKTTIAKLNFIGKAAESKEFKNAQLVKGSKLRYGSYDVPVPIGKYSEFRMERIFTSLLNQFTDEDIRIVIDHNRDENGHGRPAESLKVHIIPPLSKKERAEEDKREKETLIEQAIQDKARLKEQKKEKALITKRAKVQSEAKDKARLEESEKPKKKANKAPVTKAKNNKAKKKTGLKPLTLEDLKKKRARG